ncbi:hypothetical protein BM1_03339 [Bipolaris maydis]|nr:hypothetical protein BM1_03339 [Bipolaris maydis]
MSQRMNERTGKQAIQSQLSQANAKEQKEAKQAERSTAANYQRRNEKDDRAITVEEEELLPH